MIPVILMLLAAVMWKAAIYFNKKSKENMIRDYSFKGGVSGDPVRKFEILSNIALAIGLFCAAASGTVAIFW